MVFEVTNACKRLHERQNIGLPHSQHWNNLCSSTYAYHARTSIGHKTHMTPIDTHSRFLSLWTLTLCFNSYLSSSLRIKKLKSRSSSINFHTLFISSTMYCMTFMDLLVGWVMHLKKKKKNHTPLHAKKTKLIKPCHNFWKWTMKLQKCITHELMQVILPFLDTKRSDNDKCHSLPKWMLTIHSILYRPSCKHCNYSWNFQMMRPE